MILAHGPWYTEWHHFLSVIPAVAAYLWIRWGRKRPR